MQKISVKIFHFEISEKNALPQINRDSEFRKLQIIPYVFESLYFKQV